MESKLKLGKTLGEDLASAITHKVLNSLSDPIKVSVNNSTITFLYSKLMRITDRNVSGSVWHTISGTMMGV